MGPTRPHTLRQGVDPLGPARAIGLDKKTNYLLLFGLYRQASSWAKENEKMAWGESELSPPVIFLVFDGALCAPQAGFAGRPGTADRVIATT